VINKDDTAQLSTDRCLLLLSVRSSSGQLLLSSRYTQSVLYNSVRIERDLLHNVETSLRSRYWSCWSFSTNVTAFFFTCASPLLCVVVYQANHRYAACMKSIHAGGDACTCGSNLLRSMASFRCNETLTSDAISLCTHGGCAAEKVRCSEWKDTPCPTGHFRPPECWGSRGGRSLFRIL
jgi:hypothetical protein